LTFTLPKSVVDSLLAAAFGAATQAFGGSTVLTAFVDTLKQVVVANEAALIAELADLGITVSAPLTAAADTPVGLGITVPKAVFDAVVSATFAAINAAEAGHPFVQLATGWVQSAVAANEMAVVAELAKLGVTVQ
jgi:hypothetical protein